MRTTTLITGMMATLLLTTVALGDARFGPGGRSDGFRDRGVQDRSWDRDRDRDGNRNWDRDRSDRNRDRGRDHNWDRGRDHNRGERDYSRGHGTNNVYYVVPPRPIYTQSSGLSVIVGPAGVVTTTSCAPSGVTYYTRENTRPFCVGGSSLLLGGFIRF